MMILLIRCNLLIILTHLLANYKKNKAAGYRHYPAALISKIMIVKLLNRNHPAVHIRCFAIADIG